MYVSINISDIIHNMNIYFTDYAAAGKNYLIYLRKKWPSTMAEHTWVYISISVYRSYTINETINMGDGLSSVLTEKLNSL